jgi:hypothetical protein
MVRSCTLRQKRIANADSNSSMCQPDAGTLNCTCYELRSELTDSCPALAGQCNSEQSSICQHGAGDPGGLGKARGCEVGMPFLL